VSEYTTRQILDMIETNGGPEELDLSGRDLSGMDLSREAIAAELEKARKRASEETPVWFSKITKGINLQGVYLTGANLQRGILWCANLQDGHLWCANLQLAKLGAVNFQGANLGGTNLHGAELGGANLQGANLGGANLQGAILRYAHLEGIDLFNVKTLEGACFYNAFLDDTRLKREQLGEAIGEELEEKYDEAEEAYLALKNNFAEIGRYTDAAWAYRKERRMEKLEARRKAQRARTERKWRTAVTHYAKFAGDRLVELVCDYGEGIWRVVGTLIFVWIFFALIYGLIAGVWGPWQDTDSGQIRYITRNLIDLLSFSLGAMTTLVPADLEARSVLAMRILMPLQAMLGIVLAGLLGFVLGNRIRRS
jgi:uncharacterized protein YjbI with pentapeptide repeats